MKKFDIIDPKTIKLDPRIVAKLENKDISQGSWYLLLINAHIILASVEFFTNRVTGQQKWLSHQIEFPKQGLVWFCDTIKNKFFKTETEGGLPKGKFGITEKIDGERLKIFRAACAGGPGKPGYTFTTLDRKTTDTNSARSYNLSDELLFEEGLFAIFEDVANKIKQGIL